MRRLACQVFRLSFLLSGLFLGEIPPVNAQDAPSTLAYSTPIVECGCGGQRFSRAAGDLQQGNLLASAGDAASVDWFFASALASWADLSDGLMQQPPRLLHGSLHLYNSAVLSSVVCGHRLGRLDPLRGLTVSVEGHRHVIPIKGVGLVWRLDQIDCVRPAEYCFQNPNFAGTIRQGVGAALVGIHYRRPNIPGEERYLEEHPLAITAVLRGDAIENCCLEFHNPIQSQTLELAGRELRLTSNIAGAVAFAVEKLQTDVNPWSAFFDPEIAVAHEGVLLIEPYQPGKIPVVLVHGLLSNPATWGTMLNELSRNPALMERYQIWAYLYPTSVPFVQTAAHLRKDLRETLAFLDPGQEDPALQDMVLVGHSMGGLLSRLQVTYSGHELWNEFAKVPLSEIRGSEEMRRTLADTFYFSPQPFVKRVIFMATPHKGSGQSSRMIGCLGRALAGRPLELQELWSELKRLNRGVLRSAATGKLPSSVAGLAPKSPAMRGIAKLPFAQGVHLHSVVGTGGCKPCFPGDGVVAVDSARLPGVESELFVKATHSGVKEHPDALREVQRILWLHWAEYQNECQANPPADLIPIPAPMVPLPSPAE